MPEAIKDAIAELIHQTGIYSFLMVVILAPIFEEYIFRGVILRGLLKTISPIKAVLLSSFLFGIVHLNPWQFVTAFLIGIFSGWLYYKFKDLKLCILVHFCVNAIGFFSRFYLKDNLDVMELDYIDMLGGLQNYILIIIISSSLCLLGIVCLNRTSNQPKN